MNPESVVSRGAFQRRFMAMTAVASLLTIGLISAYLLMLLRLPRDLWVGFGQITGGFFLVLFPLSGWASARSSAPILDHLSAVEKGTDGPETLERGLRALSRLPRYQFATGLLWWLLGGVLVGGAMDLRYESFGAFQNLVMVLAALSGGFITSTFLFFAHRIAFAGLQTGLAEQVADLGRRAELVQTVSIRQKLVVAVTGVTFVTVAFAMCLSYVVSSRRLEASQAGLQGRFLEAAMNDWGADPIPMDGEWFAAIEDRARELGIAGDLLVIDGGRAEVVAGRPDALIGSEIALVSSGGAAGDSLSLDSPNVYAWRQVGADGSLLVAVKSWSAAADGGSGLVGAFVLMLSIAAGIAFALSRVLADDLGDTAVEIRGEVERMASGDLRGGRVLETGDELGSLARSFEQMVAAVRQTVASVTGAADRVDGTAGEIAEIAQSVSTGAKDQAEGVQQAAKLMEGVNRQVEGVSQAAQELNLLVEESSSSILEMGAAGDELNDTAGVLLSKVDEVSTSIEQMVRSVKQIASNTESLSDASGETSASMEEMASAMRQVDVIAEETARLSRGVIESAEQGHDKVRQTISGMESIRIATETAENVIRGLGSRAVEIGAIVDVIDDVADETNLLALNAAIIAAQAGDQGRAFSVVADEIKELADRVLASTKEIGGLIRSVQEESANAVGAIEEGSRSVASGVQMSMEAGSSLEDITRASRESGTRIQEIVQAVREQTKAAGHVVELMVRVSERVEAIQQATSEQDRGNEVVFRSSVAMREVATQLRGTTEEQARGGARIRESIDGVREAVEAINRAIQVQSESNGELVRFLEEVSSRTAANEQSAARMETATEALRGQSRALHDDVRKFEI
ncbi:MAG: methyl-accepting chemotaxis protein [Myxococcota bacterium]